MNQDARREVVRGEYFSGASEPAVTFKRGTARFSAVCLKQIPEDDYILFVIDPAGKKLVVEPCHSDERNAIRWSCSSPEKRKPKAITCREFCHRLFALMQWNDDCRYKLYGKATCGADGKTILAFDLNSVLIYKPDDSGRVSRHPDYPNGWSDGFGEPVEQRISNPLVHRFAEDTELAPIRGNPENGDKERGNERQL